MLIDGRGGPVCPPGLRRADVHDFEAAFQFADEFLRDRGRRAVLFEDAAEFQRVGVLDGDGADFVGGDLLFKRVDAQPVEDAASCGREGGTPDAFPPARPGSSVSGSCRN